MDGLDDILHFISVITCNVKSFFSDAFSDKEVLFNNKSLKHEALSIFLHIRWSCKPPLRLLGNNINVTQIAYFTLSSVFFFNLSKLLFGQGVETAQPLFNDELAFFIITILSIKLIVVVIISIKLIVVYVLSKKPQNRAQCLNAMR